MHRLRRFRKSVLAVFVIVAVTLGFVGYKAAQEARRRLPGYLSSRLGAVLGPKQPFCMIHARSESDASHAEAALRAAVVIGATTPPPRPVIIGRR